MLGLYWITTPWTETTQEKEGRHICPEAGATADCVLVEGETLSRFGWGEVWHTALFNRRGGNTVFFKGSHVFQGHASGSVKLSVFAIQITRKIE